jgi:GntR family transcriptional repressor for pyruvate dehydrogenase complex
MTTAAGGAGRSADPGGRSQSEVVIDGIKNMITSGRLSAGSRLPVEKDLADELAVSRGSLREGVRALVLMGVLETRQGDGTYVTALDPATLLGPLAVLVDLQRPGNMVDLMTVRRVLEVEAVGRAALRISDDELAQAGDALARMGALLGQDVADHQAMMEADVAFHRVIARASGNPTLSALIEGLSSHTVRARTWRSLHDEGVEARTHTEHRAILSALMAHDPDVARLRMSVHLLGVEEFVSAQRDADSAVATGATTPAQ